ncbi:hypothetical protein DFJ73DRAFT_833548 [Zopfochytrium polystomum]|nr:hypothetical protein DFJ73DRAFT_833548 [Zopfochytrium polystomum]
MATATSKEPTSPSSSSSLSLSFSLFAVPPAILAGIARGGAPGPGVIAIASGTASSAAASDDANAAIGVLGLVVDPSAASPSPSCSTCGHPQFDTTESQRAHFRTDWHRYNLKRKLAGLAPVAEERFEELVDLSSIEASDSSPEESESSNEDEGTDYASLSTLSKKGTAVSDAAIAAQLERDIQLASADTTSEEQGQVSNRSMPHEQAGSPFVAFVLDPVPLSLSTDEGERYALIAYKNVLRHPSLARGKHWADETEMSNQWVNALRSLQTPSPAPTSGRPTWLLMLMGGGHFAAAVFECGGPGELKPIRHKTFHRYTTRRKQGGAQSSMDNAKGKANSAGSALRRYNEQALEQDIKNLLTEWSDVVKSSQLVFFHAATRTRRAIFFDGGLLSLTDTRVRTFPFVTRRPTLSELTRCFRTLTTVRIVPLPKHDAPKVPKDDVSPLPAKQQIPAPVAPAAKNDIPDGFQRLLDLARRGKTAMLRSALISRYSNEPEKLSQGASTRVPDSAGTSLLHVASSCGHAGCVAMLLAPPLTAAEEASGSVDGEPAKPAIQGVGADPTIREEGGRHRTPYEVADDREVRDAFRRAFASDTSGRWDWIGGARVPSALSGELEERQKEREREKKKRMKERHQQQQQQRKEVDQETQLALAKAAADAEEKRQKEEAARAERAKRVAVMGRLSERDRESAGMTPERRALLDREKRALAAESRLRAQQNKCSACSNPFEGPTFDKFQFRYCSMECLLDQKLLHDSK